MHSGHSRLRRLLVILAAVVGFLVVAFLIVFPGRRAPIALTLATGIGIPGLQTRVDRLEDKAIRGEPFTEDDRRFLADLYNCFARGGTLTIRLRQSGQLMRHYLSRSGQDLRLAPRIFAKSRPVQKTMVSLRQKIASDLRQNGRIEESYTSETFYMADPEFPESLVGLYFGRLIVRPYRAVGNSLRLDWRAEVPWEWPSYEFLFRKYGDYHAQCFALPNARSILQGPEHCLRMDDGLGEYLTRLGLAKPFLAYSEWKETIAIASLETGAPFAGPTP